MCTYINFFKHFFFKFGRAEINADHKLLIPVKERALRKEILPLILGKERENMKYEEW